MRELLYAAPPGMERAGEVWGLTPARMGWRILPGPRLAAAGPVRDAPGGALYAACDGPAGPGGPAPCCCAIVRECRRRGMDRVVLDFEGAPDEDARALARTLDGLCTGHGLALYLPEPLANEAPRCRVLVSSLTVSGSLERRLSAALERYGPDRVVLAVEAGALEFTLPVRDKWTYLTAEQLQQILAQTGPAVFLDRGLCTHCFTYMARGGGGRLVLFDTAQSVRAKLDAAQRLGVQSAILAAPQVGDWLEEIFS